MIRIKILLSITLLLAAVSFSCGKKEPESSGTAPAASPAPAPPAPLAPGISQNLARNTGAPFYNFDSFGSVQFPTTKTGVQISSAAANPILGWALDVSKKGPAGGVDVVIDGTPYSAQYGIERSDVATHFNRPDYARCGFQLVLSPKQIGTGQHAVAIRVISSDQKSYNEGPVVQFTVN